MDKKEVIKKLKEYKKVLLPFYDLYKLVLFGSFAAGVTKEYSDIDVAVIVNKIDEDFFTYAPRLWRLRRNIDSRIEPILFIKDEPGDSGFLSEILKTGIEI
jgi:predicted nucleotidyltransferase